jgi:hypothetical protein
MRIDQQHSKETVIQTTQITPVTQNTNLKLTSEDVDFSASKHSDQKQQNQVNESLPVEVYSSKASSTNILSNNSPVLSLSTIFDGLIEWFKKGVF